MAAPFTAERGARDAARPEPSVFRRHWTWRDRLVVAVGGRAIGLVLRLLYATLRIRVVDPDDALGRAQRGERVIWAFWHDAVVLAPLVPARIAPALRLRVMLSWHRDAEIAAQAVHRFGVRVVRGSSTRGWLGAMRFLLSAPQRGEDPVVVPDGPKGPRHEAKDGVVQLARATHLPVVTLGAAAEPSHRLRSWDRMLLPLPFARVVLAFGVLRVPPEGEGDARAGVQAALDAVDRQAAAVAGSGR